MKSETTRNAFNKGKTLGILSKYFVLKYRCKFEGPCSSSLHSPECRTVDVLTVVVSRSQQQPHYSFLLQFPTLPTSTGHRPLTTPSANNTFTWSQQGRMSCAFVLFCSAVPRQITTDKSIICNVLCMYYPK